MIIINFKNEIGWLNRLKGPASINSFYDCYEYWINGVLHKEDGPAIIYPNKNLVYYYLKGKYHTKKEYVINFKNE